MYSFHWNYFPARLHSTKEVIYFLENFFKNDVKNVLQTNPDELSNLIFGDIYEPKVINSSQKFLSTQVDFKEIDTLVLEICTRKYFLYNDTIPLNYFYTQSNQNIINKYNLEFRELNDTELENDLICIKKLVETNFKDRSQIHIIPHFNLKKKQNNEKIPDRDKLIKILEEICKKIQINFHDIAKYIESNEKFPQYIEDYMGDYLHYKQNNINIIYEFVKKAIDV